MKIAGDVAEAIRGALRTDETRNFGVADLYSFRREIKAYLSKHLLVRH